MRPVIYILIIIAACLSCSKDLDLPFDNGEKVPVLNCYFSPDSSWKIELYRSFPFIGNTNEKDIISNAGIKLFENNTFIGSLSFDKGFYTFPTKPCTNRIYSIEVVIDDQTFLSAEDKIPLPLFIIDYQFDETPESFIHNLAPFSAMDVNKVSLNIKAPDTTKKYVSIRAFTKAYYDYSSIIITETSIQQYTQTYIPDSLILSLDEIKFYEFNSINEFSDSISGLSAWNYYSYIRYRDTLLAYASKTLDTINRIRVDNLELYSNDLNFKNLSVDASIVLGSTENINDESYKLDLYLDNYVLYDWENSGFSFDSISYRMRNYEIYVELRTISEGMYNYLRTLNMQLVNRLNPFSEPVSVFSNIENGVGIFAGYSEELIKIY